MGKPYPEPEFQSTLPSQGATQWFCTMSLTLVFQSTLPSQGATRTTLTIQALIMVFQSTLPSQGATFPHLVNLFANVDFNPRSPHRERHRSYIYTLEKSNFNPRSPHRERLVPLTMAGAAYQFQSTLPSQGATTAFASCLLYIPYFNPRSPHRERPPSSLPRSCPFYFNPRSPHRERRKLLKM